MCSIEERCCLCVKENNIVYNIHDKGISGQKYFDILKSLFPDLVLPKYNESMLICTECCEILKRICDFKKECVNSLEIWTKYIETKNENPVNVLLNSMLQISILEDHNYYYCSRESETLFSPSKNITLSENHPKTPNCSLENTLNEIASDSNETENDNSKNSYYMCRVCNKTLSSNINLILHMRRRHKGRKRRNLGMLQPYFVKKKPKLSSHPVQCSKKSTFETESYFADKFHNFYVCKICNKQLANFGSLQTHMMIHLDPKRYDKNKKLNFASEKTNSSPEVDFSLSPDKDPKSFDKTKDLLYCVKEEKSNVSSEESKMLLPTKEIISVFKSATEDQKPPLKEGGIFPVLKNSIGQKNAEKTYSASENSKDNSQLLSRRKTTKQEDLASKISEENLPPEGPNHFAPKSLLEENLNEKGCCKNRKDRFSASKGSKEQNLRSLISSVSPLENSKNQNLQSLKQNPSLSALEDLKDQNPTSCENIRDRFSASKGSKDQNVRSLISSVSSSEDSKNQNLQSLKQNPSLSALEDLKDQNPTSCENRRDRFSASKGSKDQNLRSLISSVSPLENSKNQNLQSLKKNSSLSALEDLKNQNSTSCENIRDRFSASKGSKDQNLRSLISSVSPSEGSKNQNLQGLKQNSSLSALEDLKDQNPTSCENIRDRFSASRGSKDQNLRSLISSVSPSEDSKNQNLQSLKQNSSLSVLEYLKDQNPTSCENIRDRFSSSKGSKDQTLRSLISSVSPLEDSKNKNLQSLKQNSSISATEDLKGQNLSISVSEVSKDQNEKCLKQDILPLTNPNKSSLNSEEETKASLLYVLRLKKSPFKSSSSKNFFEEKLHTSEHSNEEKVPKENSNEDELERQMRALHYESPCKNVVKTEKFNKTHNSLEDKEFMGNSHRISSKFSKKMDEDESDLKEEEETCSVKKKTNDSSFYKLIVTNLDDIETSHFVPNSNRGHEVYSSKRKGDLSCLMQDSKEEEKFYFPNEQTQVSFFHKLGASSLDKGQKSCIKTIVDGKDKVYSLRKLRGAKSHLVEDSLCSGENLDKGENSHITNSNENGKIDSLKNRRGAKSRLVEDSNAVLLSSDENLDKGENSHITNSNEKGKINSLKNRRGAKSRIVEDSNVVVLSSGENLDKGENSHIKNSNEKGKIDSLKNLRGAKSRLVEDSNAILLSSGENLDKGEYSHITNSNGKGKIDSLKNLRGAKSRLVENSNAVLLSSGENLDKGEYSLITNSNEKGKIDSLKNLRGAKSRLVEDSNAKLLSSGENLDKGENSHITNSNGKGKINSLKNLRGAKSRLVEDSNAILLCSGENLDKGVNSHITNSNEKGKIDSLIYRRGAKSRLVEDSTAALLSSGENLDKGEYSHITNSNEKGKIDSLKNLRGAKSRLVEDSNAALLSSGENLDKGENSHITNSNEKGKINSLKNLKGAKSRLVEDSNAVLLSSGENLDNGENSHITNSNGKGKIDSLKNRRGAKSRLVEDSNAGKNLNKGNNSHITANSVRKTKVYSSRKKGRLVEDKPYHVENLTTDEKNYLLPSYGQGDAVFIKVIDKDQKSRGGNARVQLLKVDLGGDDSSPIGVSNGKEGGDSNDAEEGDSYDAEEGDSNDAEESDSNDAEEGDSNDAEEGDSNDTEKGDSNDEERDSNNEEEGGFNDEEEVYFVEGPIDWELALKKLDEVERLCLVKGRSDINDSLGESSGVVDRDTDPLVDRDEGYKCEICNHELSSSYSLERHRLLVHSCRFRTRNKSSSSVVETGSYFADTKTNLYICKICTNQYSTIKSLRKHIQRHSGVKTFMCTVCGTKSFTQGELESHMATHRKDNSFTCTICQKGFKNKNRLNNHIKIHSEEKPLMCDICGKRFAYTSKLDRHKEIHSDTKLYACKTCQRSFRTDSALRYHRCSGSDRTFRCEPCDLTFPTYWIYDKHRLKEHKGKKVSEVKERRCRCPTCGLMYTTKSILKRHMRTHTGEKPYQCKICERKFSQSGSLNTHMRLLHSKDLAYKCEECGKKFAKPAQRTFHIKNTHSHS